MNKIGNDSWLLACFLCAIGGFILGAVLVDRADFNAAKAGFYYNGTNVYRVTPIEPTK